MILDFLAELNWAAVGVSLLVAFVIGSVWFAPPVLGGFWARQVSRYAGIPKSEVRARSSKAGPLTRWLVTMAINAVVLALAVKAVGADSPTDGVVLGFTLWLGFGASFSSWPPILARMPWEWWLVNNGAFLLMQVAMGAILASWR